MKRATVLKTVVGVFIFALIINAVLFLAVQPWLRNKVETVFNEGNLGYSLNIDKVQISFLTASIEFQSLSLLPKNEDEAKEDSVSEIASMKFNGINVYKALLKRDISINEISISNADVKVLASFSKKTKQKMVSKWNILVDKVSFNQISLIVNDKSSAKQFMVNKGFLTISELQILKQDTLSIDIIDKLDFSAQDFAIVTADSMYTFRANDLRYKSFTKLISADTLFITPSFSNYNFTSRYNYETDCFEAIASNVMVHDFSISNFMKSGDIITPMVEIGMVDVKAFRDKRKAFKHVDRATFQEMMYNYTGLLRVDSINVMDGNITYTEHGEESNEAGFISFNGLKAIVTNVTNDTIYKKESAFFELRAKGLLMGKGKLSVHLKSKIFDPQNRFSLEGALTSMDITALNPMLENNAFVSALSGTIDSMDFNFIANNTKATGTLTMRYNDFKFEVLNKQDQEKTTAKEQIKSFVGNAIVFNSNPDPGKDVRVGVIDYTRDPEKFLFNYSFKSIFSGIKTSITK